MSSISFEDHFVGYMVHVVMNGSFDVGFFMSVRVGNTARVS